MSPRLLVVADALDGGLGAAVAAHEAWFEGEGWQVTMCGPADIGLPGTARDASAMARAASALRRMHRAVRPDVVHCHGLRSFAVARVITSSPPFVTLHGSGPVPSDPPAYDRVRRAGRGIVPRLAAGAFTATPDGAPGWRFVAHASPRLGSLAVAPIPDGPPTFLWLGRLDEPKEPERFVRAVAAVADVGGRGVMAGDGRRRRAVTELIEQLDAPVDMLGHRDDVAELLAAAWALVLFSTHEAVSFAVQEAMWCGRAVVTSDLPGLRWLTGGAAATMRELCDLDVARRRGAEAAAAVRAKIRPGDPWPAVAAAYAARR
jgi:glycosyltransferase involved in cell wall biosynthesis